MAMESAQPAREQSGILAWLTTTDHKRIGILYMVTSFGFLLAGVTLAMLMRTQLIVPRATFLGPDLYNQIFTMHALTMVFLFLMPMLAGLGNYIVPLMIGARDMAFPRLNAFSYWIYLFGALFLYSSFATGSAPDAGWFAYAPLTERSFSPGNGMDFYVLAIVMLGTSSTAGAINFVATVITLRAPGMNFNHLPLFVWSVFITAIIIIFAMPAVSAAAVLLFADRHFGTTFYQGGGDALLWQHLFWSFGHPEVYILILPAMGIISEVLPVFSRKPIFGYAFIAWSTVAIGFLSFTVWAHHMFAVGMPLLAQAFFSASSYSIAVPTGVKIFNWIATLWGGRLQLKPALFFACGFIGQFVVGGITGVFVAIAPFDWQVTDTYFVVAHFHYVLVGGAIFGVFAGLFYWFPKMTGRLLSERLGIAQFITLFVGFNLTFFPMHILGLMGMPRRIYTYAPGLGWESSNMISTIGGYILAVSFIIFLWNFFATMRRPRTAGADPWDAWTLEWATSSPPPPQNFDRSVEVRGRRPLWDEKHPENPDWRHGH